MTRKRIEMARQGLDLYEKKRFAEAAQIFLSYIRILEEWKKTPVGTLSPTHFDQKKDLAEMLLISSVYWHLVKLFDRSTAGTQQESDFRMFMQQFLVFTKGLPYQPLASETMRKFIRSQKPNHASEFNVAYKQIGSAKCFVATAVFDLIEEDTLFVLREYRDRKLMRSRSGRIFVKTYYAFGPWLAAYVSRMPTPVRRKIAKILDQMASRLR